MLAKDRTECFAVTLFRELDDVGSYHESPIGFPNIALEPRPDELEAMSRSNRSGSS